MKYLLFLCLFSILSCKKDPLAINETLIRGEWIVEMNGERVNYRQQINDNDSTTLSLIFFEKRQFNLETIGFSIGRFPKREGNFKFTTLPLLLGGDPKAALVYFAHVVEEDLAGYRYQFDKDRDNYFFVEKLDTINKTIKGEGRVQFKLESKNGWEFAYMPDHIIMEFKFFLDY
jgi:hypothetical protein